MNPLRNRVVVGALAVTAVALVTYNTVSTARRDARPSNIAPVTPTRLTPAPAGLVPTLAPSSVASPGATGSTEVAELSPTAMDWRAVENRVTNWLQTPRRDPFRSRIDPQSQAARFLRLQAVWRQTGSNLAVINDRVVSEGDRILEFNVDQIGPDRVWVTGPNGREELAFGAPAPAAPSTKEPPPRTDRP